MYSHPRKGLSVWLVVITAALLVFGGYYTWRGVLNFLDAGGNISAPVTATVSRLTSVVNDATETEGTLVFFDATVTPKRTCIDFKVTVVRARARDCAKDTCETVRMPVYGDTICVYGVSTSDPDWYEINLQPEDILPLIAYMHKSVIAPLHPTARPTQTFTPLPTVTPMPTLPRTATPTEVPTDTPNPATPPTRTPIPTPTQPPPIQAA